MTTTPLATTTLPDPKLLSAWLADHATLGAGALETARRMRDADRWSEHRPVLERAAQALKASQADVHVVLETYGTGTPTIREAAARLGERVGRLKGNGHLVTESPATRLVELHGLLTCLRDLRDVWRTLLLLPLDAVDAQANVARLQAGIEGLDDVRPTLVPEALVEA